MYKKGFKKEMEKYANVNESPRTYIDKYYGNDKGLSLETVTEQGYTNDLTSLMPVFNQYNKPSKSVEHFTGSFKNGVEGNKKTQMYLSEKADSFPRRYYDNTKGHSLQSITDDRRQPKIEGFNNYDRRPFRDGYKQIQKTKPIRSGPFRYNENKFGHSLESITKAGGSMAGLAFSN